MSDADADSTFNSFDTNGDGVLDFAEFCHMVRTMEPTETSLTELRARFNKLDTDGGGTIDMYEYAGGAILEILARADHSAMFAKMDVDGNHRIDKEEFAAVVRTFGVPCTNATSIDLLFALFDEDGSGQLDFEELALKLTPSTVAKHRKALKASCTGRRSKALGTQAQLSSSSSMSVQMQLTELLNRNMSRVIDLFRDWDTDGSGTVSMTEFRKAVLALGYDGPRSEVDNLFKFIDRDGSGSLEFKEIWRALRKGAKQFSSAHEVIKESSPDAQAFLEALPDEVNVLNELEKQLAHAEEATRDAVTKQTALEEENSRLTAKLRAASDERSHTVKQLASLARTLAVSEAQWFLEIKELKEKCATLQEIVCKHTAERDGSDALSEVRRLREEKQVLKTQLAVLTDTISSPSDRKNGSPNGQVASGANVYDNFGISPKLSASHCGIMTPSASSLALQQSPRSGQKQGSQVGTFGHRASMSATSAFQAKMEKRTEQDPSVLRAEIEEARRQKAVARALAKEQQQARIQEENRELAKRRASAGARDTKLLSASEEAARADVAARRRAEKAAKEAELVAQNREIRKRLQKAGPAVDTSSLF